MTLRPPSPLILLLPILSLGISGCFGPWAKRLADKEAYRIIDQKQEQVLGDSPSFTIDRETHPLTEEILATAGKASDEFTTQGLRISLADTLSLAIHNSRTYQAEKENLYLAALNLTEERDRFSPFFTGAITASTDRSPIFEAGQLADVNRSGNIDTDFAVSQLIAATGARITVGFANSFVRFYGGDPTESATGALSGSIVQPLLRGAGMRVATENLKQAERGVIYAVRDFARFERDFIVDRIDEYFRLLEFLNNVENERASYESLQRGRERTEALAEAGRIDVFQLDQARQEELTARNRWINAQTNFIQRLDAFKINLGLPTDLSVFPDERDLVALMDARLEPISMTPDQAVAEALDRRLDYMTATNMVEDAERKIYIAENALLPDLDVTFSATIPDEGGNRPLTLDYDKRSYRTRIDLGLPLERKNERNNYRRALIALERTKRSADLSRDTILQEVRSALQNLEEARQSYDIQRASLEVAQRRVDSSTMLLEAGRKTVRDVLESEVSLRDARNALTAAVIDYMIARLRFLVAIEGLEIDDQGNWTEVGPKPSEEMPITDATL